MGLLNKLFRKNKDDFSSYTYQEEFSEEKWQAAVNAANEKFDRTFHLNSEDSILSIPVVKLFKIDETFNGVTSCYNILNKKATAFKKENRMDLAIACLRKLNQYMEMSGRDYTADDYLRLVEFLKQDRQFEAAREELAIIESKFPHFFNKSYNPKFYKTLSKAKHFNRDLIAVHAPPLCPHCSPYNSVAYSISGKSKTFPPLSQMPEFLKMYTCEFCNCVIGHQVIIDEYSHTYYNSPVDRRTEIQKENFKQIQLEKSKKEIAKLEYDWLWENLEEYCPKSVSSYSRMKNSNSANFQKIVAAAKEKGFDIITL